MEIGYPEIFVNVRYLSACGGVPPPPKTSLMLDGGDGLDIEGRAVEGRTLRVTIRGEGHELWFQMSASDALMIARVIINHENGSRILPSSPP